MKEKDEQRIVIFLVFAIAISILVLELFSIFDSRTKVVFCDVGQGDAAYLRIKNRVDVLIDAGPNKKALDCLGKFMPFFDKTLEIVILSHGQKDHIGGMEHVFKRYKVKNLFYNPLPASNQTVKQLHYLIKLYKIPVHSALRENAISIDSSVIIFLWPSYLSLARLNKLYPNNINDLSSVFLFKEKQTEIVFTGDASYKILERLFRQSTDGQEYMSRLTRKPNDLYRILKISHHGSKNGTSYNLLRLADIDTGVISVGKNNSYRHPARSTLDILKAAGVKVRRTDLEGDIVFTF